MAEMKRGYVYNSIFGNVRIPCARIRTNATGETRIPIDEAERMEHYSAVVQLRKIVKYLAYKPHHKVFLALCLILPGGVLLWFGYQWLNRRANHES